MYMFMDCWRKAENMQTTRKQKKKTNQTIYRNNNKAYSRLFRAVQETEFWNTVEKNLCQCFLNPTNKQSSTIQESRVYKKTCRKENKKSEIWNKTCR